ncbi:PIG-L family deacetylase [Algoriphagus halophytocola]|uniref:PIG-L family deacetylase n=1 Tax=Algoriphagus halophytocola TaxID=2991499 RepID=A0ABY6MLU6_9BACT|nr:MULTISPECIES: PIG-L family deacetylase [unclassified Algoriphagus]UZD23169.1 PIG-L family deacetylase [Algoriphagus sp. TR-M5]WBL44461.1 PIG-L family deacetylase [Algoriphagus sp. TR-M9]
MGIRKGIKITLIIGISIVVLVPLVLIGLGRRLLHDSSIPQQELLFRADSAKTILAFFPHPDDEVTVAGTLMKMNNVGHRVILVCLTQGEAADTNGAYTPEELAEIRTLEMNHAAEVIGAEYLELLSYPDGGLANMGVDSIKSIALQAIQKFKPDALISYDSKVGLYGHPDHKLTGLALEQLFQDMVGKSGFSPRALFQVTLSPKQIDLAMKMSKGFQENYPIDPTQGLPNPSFYIKTTAYFDRVMEVVSGHASQAETLQDLLPYHDVVPGFIYSRIFDREYFYEVPTKKPPVQVAFR